jgi:hypothetical protein
MDVYALPGGHYERTRQLREGDSASPAAAPDVTMAVSEVLGSLLT